MYPTDRPSNDAKVSDSLTTTWFPFLNALLATYHSHKKWFSLSAKKNILSLATVLTIFVKQQHKYPVRNKYRCTNPLTT